MLTRQQFRAMFMNAEDSVTNIRDLLLNLGDDNNTASFRTWNDEGDDIDEVEMTPTEMSGYLFEHNDLEMSDDLYITLDAFPSGVDVIITTYER